MILVTGGLGFIGSHTVVSLLEKGYQVLIVDDLSNSSIEVIAGIEAASGTRPSFLELNLQDSVAVAELFERHTITCLLYTSPSPRD